MSLEMVSTVEAARQSGCSYRQVDYWIRTGAVPATTMMTGLGSGKYRQIPAWYIPRLKLLGNVSKLFGIRNGPPVEMMRDLFDNYDKGQMAYDEITVSWKVEK